MGFSSAPIFLSINDEFTKKVFKMGAEENPILASLLCGKKINVYEFNGEEEGVEVLADMGFSSAPIFLSINDEFTKKVFKMGSDFTSFIDFIGSLNSALDN
jgi:hypothetical protein